MLTQPTMKPWIKAALFLALASLLIAGCAGAGANTWPTLAASEDAVYMAQAQLKKVDAVTGALAWSYPEKADAQNIFYGTPALANGWVIAGNYSQVLTAVDQKSGVLIWSNEDHKGKGRFLAGPVVAGEKVLIPGTDSYLYAFDLTSGKELWKFKAESTLWAPVAVDADAQTAYLAGMDHNLYAIDLENGSQRWVIDMEAPMVHAPALNGDGALYVSTFAEKMVAIRAESRASIWETAIEGKVWSTPLLVDGKLYFGTDAGKVYALDAETGVVEWTRDANGPVLAAPAQLGEAIAFVSETGQVFTITPDGGAGWTRSVEGKLYSSPVVVNNYLAVSGMEMENYLVSFDAQGTPGWTFGP